MAKKLFTTIYGRNLVGELKNIVQRPYLVVTMEDLWDRFKDEFDDDCIVHFVKTLEYDEIMAEVERLPKFEAVIGLGGGQAVDYAKMAAWKTHMPLYQVPTSIATNAVFGHRAGVRFDSVVRYVGYVEPVAVYVCLLYTSKRSIKSLFCGESWGWRHSACLLLCSFCLCRTKRWAEATP